MGVSQSTEHTSTGVMYYCKDNTSNQTTYLLRNLGPQILYLCLQCHVLIVHGLQRGKRIYINGQSDI